MTRSQLAISSVLLAPRLLGARVRSTVGGELVEIRLTEVEAYEGIDDPASHAYRGPTARNGVMFGPAGFLYTYFTYGMHWCANIVCAEPGRASAVLLRAGTVVLGHETARARRPAARSDRDLARGPARLAQCLALGREHNGLDLLSTRASVRLMSLGPGPSLRAGPVAIVQGPRVGIRVATDRPWRFWLADEPSVSAFRPGVLKARAARPAH
ncbi:MAG: DNA-3-methyladenine glycosylase [Actinobacteria bacterium]|nr:DNA-3-methyladenine glycosylase [Actinomycetota bacterium]